MCQKGFNGLVCLIAVALTACNPPAPQLPASYTSLSDDEIMILFTKAVGAMEHDYRNPQPGMENLEREVTRRKLASLGDIDKIYMAGRYPEQGEAYVGMRAKVLIALRGKPYNYTKGISSERWEWGEGVIRSQNRYTTRDYVCIRDDIVVGVRYTYCDFGDCSSNKERGENC